MARVTVEDCIDKVESRFKLVLLAGHRARQISGGQTITVPRDNDKNPVVALREIAEEKLSTADLEEDLIHSLQKQVEVDEPEGQIEGDLALGMDNDSVGLETPVFQDGAEGLPPMGGSIMTESEDAPDAGSAVHFDSLSEEELLAGIEGLDPPENKDDF